MMLGLLTLIAFFAALVFLVILTLKLMNVAAWGGILLTLAWLGVLIVTDSQLKRLAETSPAFRVVAVVFDRLFFHTLLLQGVLVIAITLTAMAVMTGNVPKDRQDLFFGVIMIMLWVTSVILGLGLGIGGPLHLVERLCSEVWKARLYTPVVLVGFCAGSAFAVAVPLVLEKYLVILRNQSSLGAVFWIVLAVIAWLSAGAMQVLFGDMRGTRQYYM